MVGNRMALLEFSGLLAPRNIALLILAAAVAAIGGAFA